MDMTVTNLVYADLLEMALRHEARSVKLLKALQSIANSTCCGSCQEAVLVARTVLEDVVIDYRSVPSTMLTPYGKKIQEAQEITDLLSDYAALQSERDRLAAVVQEKNDALSNVWTERDALSARVAQIETLLGRANYYVGNACTAGSRDLRNDIDAALRGGK